MFINKSTSKKLPSKKNLRKMFLNGNHLTSLPVHGTQELVGEFYTIFFIIFSEYWWHWLLLPVAYLMAPIHGMIINWFGHIYGYVNFKVSDTSKNLFRFDWLMLGEGYHNNHHKFGGRPNFGGVRWHEIDVTYLIMLFLEKLGWIKMNRVMATPKREI